MFYPHVKEHYELFEQGMELIRKGDYKSAEQYFLRAREIAEKEIG